MGWGERGTKDTRWSGWGGHTPLEPCNVGIVHVAAKKVQLEEAKIVSKTPPSRVARRASGRISVTRDTKRDTGRSRPRECFEATQMTKLKEEIDEVRPA